METPSLKKMLRPAFAALARPGIVGPHEDVAGLLLSGAKPAGYLLEHETDDIARLDAAAADSRLIRIVKTREAECVHHLWLRADRFEETWAAIGQRVVDGDADTLEDLSDELTTPSADNSRATGLTGPFHFAAGRFLEDSYSRFDPIQLREIEELAQGRRPFIVAEWYPNFIDNMRRSHARLKELVADKTAIQRSFSVPETTMTYYYAQPGQQAALEELTADQRPSDARMGRLLGYSDNDIALFEERKQNFKHMNAFERAVLSAANPLRRWARDQVMKIDGPNWRRNPD